VCLPYNRIRNRIVIRPEPNLSDRRIPLPLVIAVIVVGLMAASLSLAGRGTGGIAVGDPTGTATSGAARPAAPTAAATAPTGSATSRTPGPGATPAPTLSPTRVTVGPTSAPHATPTPTPTAKATLAATPTPGGLCNVTFAQAPSTTTDQSAAIATFLTTNKGKRVCFTPGAVYRTDARISLSGWAGTVYGQGATFKRYVSSTGQGAQISIAVSTSVIFDGLNVAGPATLSDIQSRVFGTGDREDQHAFDIESTAGFTLRNAALSGLWGDGVYLRSINYNGNNTPSTNVLIQNVTVNVAGRNCISLISIQGLTVSRVGCANASLHGLDGEPNRTTDVLSDMTISDSSWSAWDAGHTPQGVGYAIVLGPGYADVQSHDVSILRNTMDNTSSLALLKVGGYSSTARSSNIVVTGNRPALPGPAYFSHMSGLTFGDNGSMTEVDMDVVP
jgi:hypothetical protein